jgi:hypothetical protein
MSRKFNRALVWPTTGALFVLLSSTAWAVVANVRVNIPIVRPKVSILTVKQSGLSGAKVITGVGGQVGNATHGVRVRNTKYHNFRGTTANGYDKVERVGGTTVVGNDRVESVGGATVVGNDRVETVGGTTVIDARKSGNVGAGNGALADTGHVKQIGQRATVDFQEGNPNTPIIVGGVYNARSRLPPTPPPRRLHRAAIRLEH